MKEEAFLTHPPNDPWYIRLVYIGGTSRKFWEAWGEARNNDQVFTRWGREGAAGQAMMRTMADLYKLLKEKVGKGYRYTQATLVGRGPNTFSVPWDLQPGEDVTAMIPSKIAIPKGYKEDEPLKPVRRAGRKSTAATRFADEQGVTPSEIKQGIRKTFKEMQEQVPPRPKPASPKSKKPEKPEKPKKKTLKELMREKQRASEW
jgi:predicted DNA-binding WGR domain protein